MFYAVELRTFLLSRLMKYSYLNSIGPRRQTFGKRKDYLIKILNLYLLVCLGICLGAVRVERTAAPLAGSPSR